MLRVLPVAVLGGVALTLGCAPAAAPPEAAPEVVTIALSDPIPSAGRLGGVTVAPDGTIYMSNFGASVWRITPEGQVALVSESINGTSGNVVLPDGRLVQASFVGGNLVTVDAAGAPSVLASGLAGPVGMAVNAAGDIVVANCQGASLSVVSLDGEVRSLAEGPLFACPNGVTRGPNAAMYVVNFNNPHVLRVTDGGEVSVVTTLPGTGNAHIAFAQGAFYVTRVNTNDIYRVEPSGSFQRWAGAGDTGGQDGALLSASLARPNGIAVSPDGRYLYVNTIVGEWRGEEPTELRLRRIGPLASSPPADPELPDASSVPIDSISIEANGMVFDALAAGPDDGELVLLLHGFPQIADAWRRQLAVLGAAGYRAVAPNQRGYSAGARPDGVAPYAMPNLVRDVMAMADSLGADTFHLVAHDWGAAVAWVATALNPGRVRTLTVLSTPHVTALTAARGVAGSDQAQRSSYLATLAQPGADEVLLADAAAGLRAMFSTLPPEKAAVHLEAMRDPQTLRAALAWYRASFGAPVGPTPSATSASPPPPPPIAVPTTYIWSTEDTVFGRDAALATVEYVSGPYRFEVIEGLGHWLPELAADRVSALILARIEGRDEGPVGPG